MSEPGETRDDDLLANLADDFAARLRRGERAGVEEYAAKHPELAEQIRKAFPAIAVIEESRSTDFRRSGEGPGDTIGRYKLLERIGEGGFGVVYMAEQQTPVRRKLALKILKPGMDSRQVLARFEAERQALAIMDHPNIAKVFDGGMTDSGRPYFVMELVKGVPITDFCDQQHFTPRQRLELFDDVCHAVQHAHQKGIIHRDIKPSNVLVIMHDTTPVVKVIDFGVAKAVGQELTDKTLFTGFAQLLGTPLYMSPEQAGQSALDVDTRSDIYSLGVLLYELLTGTTPFDKERFKQAAQDEIRRIIREEEPPRPSTRLSESKDSLASISAQRHTEPAKLTKLVRGELDWIVMKALEKERSRRYESASALGQDVQRYLADEPVLAAPPSTVYRLRRYARKYRVALATVAAFATLLVAATICSLSLASWALRERSHAQEQKQSAEANFKRALDAVDQMLTRVGDVQLTHIPQMELVRRDLLQDALHFYQEFLKEKGDSPVVRAETARAYRRVGEIQFFLGQRQEAEAAYDQAAVLLQQLLAESPGDPSLRGELAVVHQRLGMLFNSIRQWKQAEASLQQAVQLLEQLERDQPTLLKNRLNLAKAHTDLVVLFRYTGRLEQAETSFRKGMTILDSLLAGDPKNTDYLILRAAAQSNIGNVLVAAGRTNDAEAVYQSALSINQQLMRQQPEVVEHRRRTGAAYNNLGLLYARNGEHEKAEATYLKSLELKEGILRDYPKVVLYMVDLAGAYGNIATEVRMRSPEEALGWADRSIRILESVLDQDDRYVEARMVLFNDLMGRAYALRRLGRHDDAARDWRRSLEVSEGNPHINMRLYRPLLLVYLGEHARAMAEIESLLNDGHSQGPNLIVFASAYSLGSEVAAKDQRLPEAQRQLLADQYGMRAVELLRKARDAGHFKNAGPLADLQDHNDFNPIRSRPDFKRLLLELEEAAPSTLPTLPDPRN